MEIPIIELAGLAVCLAASAVSLSNAYKVKKAIQEERSCASVFYRDLMNDYNSFTSDFITKEWKEAGINEMFEKIAEKTYEADVSYIEKEISYRYRTYIITVKETGR